MLRIVARYCWVPVACIGFAVILHATGCASAPHGKNLKEGSHSLFVAPGGNDAISGERRAPFATLHAALDSTRKLGTERPRRIMLLPGEYFLDAPLTLNAADSGLTIEASKRGDVTLYGGKPIAGWERDGDRFWSAKVSDAQRDARMLVVNGRFCKRARLPESGYFEHLTVFDVPWMSTTGGGWKRKPTHEELTTLTYNPADLGEWLDVRSAELTVYHMWDESVVGVAANDAQAHTLTFSNEAGHPAGAFGVKKYVVWNVREGMTQPGQWYLDRAAGRVVYWPLPGEDMESAAAILPTMESIVVLDSKNGPVKNVTLRGLRLSVTNTPLKAGGFGASAFAGAIQVGKSENCRIEDVGIANVNGQGIQTWGSDGLLIARCHVHDTGAGGIRAGGGVEVSDCHIHHVGRTYPSGIALSGNEAEGKSVRFLHNLIHDTTYSGIVCGGDNHVIEGNHIHHVMQELHDGAGIYVGFGKGMRLAGNWIHDIESEGGYGASAYYLDEQAENCVVEGNLSTDCAWPSHNHMAKNNTIRNNVFICSGDAKLTFPRSSGFTFERNVVVVKGRLTVTNPNAIVSMPNNVFYSEKGKVEGIALDQYKATDATDLTLRDGSVCADPKLASCKKGRPVFSDAHLLRALGIKPVDVRDVGPRR
ncbi:MAG: right-handed parallel beta-helix repeat-containing protein [Candidatus Hydrogenedentes bacterium]|nr:right-handed parallel beta-helix repeat-containing protein [Candidatus Hydrogenedentota bacterium]